LPSPGLADNAVTNTKLAANAVTSAKIQDLTIIAGDIADTTITSGKLASGAAAANVGTLSGVLTGTLPSPGMAAGAAATNVGTLSGALSGTLPGPSLKALTVILERTTALVLATNVWTKITFDTVAFGGASFPGTGGNAIVLPVAGIWALNLVAETAEPMSIGVLAARLGFGPSAGSAPSQGNQVPGPLQSQTIISVGTASTSYSAWYFLRATHALSLSFVRAVASFLGTP
jgi:hypothetical protein